jgi:phospholipid/cholesterol/gamma-HCH transport system substrate-binding protein
MKLSSEAKVGLVVLLGILVLTYMTFTAGGFRFGQESGYQIFVIFESAAGLDEQSQVRLAGVDIGRVERVELTDSKAKVTLRIDPDIKLKEGATASVRAMGLLGEKFLELRPGPGPGHVKEGATIPESEQAADLDRLIDQASAIAADVKTVTQSLRAALGTPEGEQSLKDIVASVRELTTNLNDTVKSSKDDFVRAVANIEDFSGTLKEDGPEVLASARRVMAQLEEIAAKVDSIVARVERGEGTIGKLVAKEDVYNKLDSALGSLNNITQKVERGEGTIGKLFSDEKAYEQLSSTLEGLGGTISRIQKFKTIVGIRNEYQFDEGDNKGYFSLTLQPREDKFYTVEIVDDPRGEVRRTVTQVDDREPVEKIESKRRLKFSALFGKRFADLTLRAGLMENSFGAGVDYDLLRDHLQLSFDAWDFSSDDPLNTRVHLKGTARLTLFRFLFVQGGYDNFLNKDIDTYFVGGGLRVEDDDLKYLIGGAGALF